MRRRHERPEPTRRSIRRARRAAAWCGAACLWLAAGCGEQEQGQPPPWATGGVSPATVATGVAAQAAAATPTGAVARTAPGDDTPQGQLLTRLKGRKWTTEDFVESDGNRDPFHPYLFDIGQGELPTPQYEILMSKYSLDEIKLQMVVGPPEVRGRGDSHVPARAMFVDPAGMGRTVVRGDHISRADAQVFRIDADKGQVIVKLREELGNGKSREVERVLELHTGVEAP